MQKKTLIFLILLFLITLIRLFIFYFNAPEYKDGQSVSFNSSIISNPKISHGFQTFSIQVKAGKIIYIGLNKPQDYFYGDNIDISGNLKIKLLNNKFKILTLTNPKIELVKKREINLLAVINSLRQNLIIFFQNNLPPNSSALILGIVFGIKENMSNSFLTDLKTVGVMHVIAASGMNVTLVSGFLCLIFFLT